MSAKAIFNPTRTYSAELGFNPNPNYGGTPLPANNVDTQRPRFGAWQTRSIGAAGYSFDMMFVDRPIEQVLYIRKFFQQHQRGWFTYIDYENHERQHVGRFTKYTDNSHNAHLKYTVRVLFEEVPGAPMVKYPSDFHRNGYSIRAVDDGLNGQVDFGGTWVAQQTPFALANGMDVSDPATYETFAAAAAINNFAQVEYAGWGFRMNIRRAAGMGVVNVLVDNVAVVTGLNLVTGVAASTAGAIVGPGLMNGQVTTDVTMTSVPLGRHRVKMLCTTTGAIAFPALEVMS